MTRDEALGFQEGAVLRLRYFIRGRRLWVSIRNQTARQNHQIDVPRLLKDQWAQTEIPLKDLRGNLVPSRRIQAGDVLTNLAFGVGEGDGPAYWDDIEVLVSQEK